MSESPADLQRQLYVNLYLSLVSFTLLYYDYLLTLPDEISRFWAHKKFSWAAFFFYLNRYVAFCGNIPVFVEYFLNTPVSPQKSFICQKLQSFHQYFAVISQVIVAIILIMRTYALYEFKKWTLALMLTVSGAAIAFGLWVLLAGKASQFVNHDLPSVGCPAVLTQTQAMRIGAGWAGMLVFDVMIFILTFAKALSLRSRTVHGLLTLMIRDGSIYFAVMIASNLGNILTFMLGGSRIHGAAMTFTNVISTVMITRLMLNLRDPKLVEAKGSRYTTTTSRSSGPMSTLVDRAELTRFTGFSSGLDPGSMIHDDRERDGDSDIELIPFSRLS